MVPDFSRVALPLREYRCFFVERPVPEAQGKYCGDTIPGGQLRHISGRQNLVICIPENYKSMDEALNMMHNSRRAQVDGGQVGSRPPRAAITLCRSI